MTATKKKPEYLLGEALHSLRRALRPFDAVKVAPSVNDEFIVLELTEDADDNDRQKARAMERMGWEAWPVKAEGPGMNRDLARRRWG